MKKAKCLKRISALVLFLAAMTSVSAVSWKAGTFLGARYRSTSSSLFSYGAFAAVDDFSFNFSAIGAEDFAATLSYDLKVGKTIHNYFTIHIDNVPGEGGFSTLSYLFSQHFKSRYLFFSYALGVQGGISYSPFSPPFFSLIPAYDLRAGFCLSPFSLSIYTTTAMSETIEWKMVLNSGLSAVIALSEKQSIFVDSFIVLDNLMDVSNYLLSGWALRVGYAYKGGAL